MRECVRAYYLGGGYICKKEKVHLVTRNVQITAYKQLNSWYDLFGPQLQRPSFWALIFKGNPGDVRPESVCHLFSPIVIFKKYILPSFDHSFLTT